MNLDGFIDFDCVGKYPYNVTDTSENTYYTLTENLQLLTDGTNDNTEIIKYYTGNDVEVWSRLINGLESGDRLVMFNVFWLFDSMTFTAILNAISRGVTTIGITTMETQFNGPGSINMGNVYQTEQRQQYIAAGGYNFPLHFTSFVNDGTQYPWLQNSYGASINHSKMIVFDKVSYPAMYIGSQNPEFDTEDMGITIENAPSLVADALAVLNRFIWCSILQNASNLGTKLALYDDLSGQHIFIGYSNEGIMSYAPGNPRCVSLPVNCQTWSGISTNLQAALTSISANLDSNLIGIRMSLDPSLFRGFNTICKYNEYNKLGMYLSDYSNYQNYQNRRPKNSFLYTTDIYTTESLYHGNYCYGHVYIGVGPPQLCASDSGSTYDLTALCKTIDCAQHSLDICDMDIDPNLNGYPTFTTVWDRINQAIIRGVNVRIMTDKQQSGEGYLLELQKTAASQSGCKGTIAIRVWDNQYKYSYYARVTHTSAYHCKYVVNENRVYLGNQNFVNYFYGGMGGVSLVIQDCKNLRDQYLNYYNRDWESPFIYDITSRWAVCPGAMVDQCFQYGPLQNYLSNPIVDGSNPNTGDVPAGCLARINTPSKNNGSFYLGSNGNYLRTCSDGNMTVDGVCIPNQLFSNMKSTCYVFNPITNDFIPPEYGDKICLPINSQTCNTFAGELSYQYVISIPGNMTIPFSSTVYNSIPEWEDTYSAWISATKSAITNIDCVFIYSTIDTIQNSLAGLFFQELINASRRNVNIRLIFAYPPNAYWQQSEKEIMLLLGATWNGTEWITLPNVAAYQINYAELMMSDNVNLPFINPFGGPSLGILHTKLYVWDNKIAYVGAQNQENPIAVEAGLMISHDCMVNDLTKIVDFYVLASCMQCRGGGISSLVASVSTDTMKQLQTTWNRDNMLSVKIRDKTDKSSFKEQSFDAQVYFSVAPLTCAKITNRTFDLDAIQDVFDRATNVIYIAAMDFSNTTDFYQTPSFNFETITYNSVNNVSFPTLFDLISNATDKGINVRILSGLRRSFGDNNPEPCGYNPKNLNAILNLQDTINTRKKGQLVSKFLAFDCSGQLTDYCYGIFHSKFIVTDKSVMMITSNLTGDYFISTAGVSFVCHITDSSQPLALQNELLNFYKALWDSPIAILTENVICRCDQMNFCQNGQPIVRSPPAEITQCFGDQAVMKNKVCLYSEYHRSGNGISGILIVGILIVVFVIVGVVIWVKRRR